MFKWINEASRIYTTDENGKLLAEITWTLEADQVAVVDHTFVDENLRGQGVAGQLMQEAVKYFRAQGYKTYGTCSYADHWYARHEETVEDILVKRS